MDFYKNLNIDDIDGEIWVDVTGFDGIFSASNFGRIKSEGRLIERKRGSFFKKAAIIMQQKRKNGLIITLRHGPDNVWTTVERIIFTSFNPEIDIKDNECVAHKNKIGTDNRLENLFVLTVSDSHNLNFKKGLLPHLESNNNSKHIKFEKEYCNIKTKKCNQCGEIKSKEMFEKKRYTCRSCRNEKNLERYYKSKQVCKT
jgi:hypothetical protein